MQKSMKPLDYARAACDTMTRKFAAADLPPKGRFHYHQGVFLSGMYKTYRLCGNEAYFTYMKDWVDSTMDGAGNFLIRSSAHMDDMQPGILIYHLLDRTGDPKYKAALDTLIADVPLIQRISDDGFWHKPHYPNQMWLDGLYMAGPLMAEYAARFDRPDLRALMIKQALLMEKNTKDAETGLLYHAYDESREAAWADSLTGHSPEFWGRSIAWVPVALLDDLDFIDKSEPGYDGIVLFAQSLLKAVCNFQSEDGRWYQVVNKGGQAGNWLENSCSCLFAAALCKAVAKGLLDASYLQNAQKAYNGVINSLEWDGGDVLIGNVCIGTGVGDYKHYCDRPVSVNDLHGVGAFLLMCAGMAEAEG